MIIGGSIFLTIRSAASLLGFDEEMWDGDESTPLYEKALDELSDAERCAASLLKLEGEFSTPTAASSKDVRRSTTRPLPATNQVHTLDSDRNPRSSKIK